MKHSDALTIAERVRGELAPFCEKIEIAGSVRRCRPEVKDIEIVCVPRSGLDMFGGAGGRSPLLDYLDLKFIDRHLLVKGKDKYRMYALADGIKLDLFMVTPPAQFGLQFVIRTGPADFSHRLVTPRKYGGAAPSNLRFKYGAAWLDGGLIPMPTEESVFEYFNLPFIPPSERV